MHMHKRLAHRYPTEVVPGVTSVSGAAAVARPAAGGARRGAHRAARHAVRRRARRVAGDHRLRRGDEARPHLPGGARGLRRAPACSTGPSTSSGRRPTRQRTMPLADVDPATVPYFSLALLPSALTGPSCPARSGRARRAARRRGRRRRAGSRGSARWTTPEAADALAARRRPGRLRPLPGPGAGQPAADAAPQRQPGRGRAGRRTRSSWPGPDGGSRWSPAATRASSRWPPRCSRSPSGRSSPASRCGCCPG